MKKNFRTVKASLIMGLLLISVFAILVPASPAKAQGGLLGFASIINVNWANVNESGVAVEPLQEYRSYELKVDYSVTRGPFGKSIYNWLYIGRRVDIKLELIDYPREWSTVFIPFDTITVNLQRNIEQVIQNNIVIMISVDETAPAYKDGTISIRAYVPKIGMIQGFDKTFQLTLKPAFLGMLSVLPETQHKLIGPMDTAEIPIRVTNLGNGRTKALFRVTSVYDDWMSIVTDQIILEPKQTSTIFFNVKPPKGFGYHDESKTFIIEYIPAWAENPEIRAYPEYVSIAIESRGISVIGIEVILPIIILIILIIFAVYYFQNRIRRK